MRISTTISWASQKLPREIANSILSGLDTNKIKMYNPARIPDCLH